MTRGVTPEQKKRLLRVGPGGGLSIITRCHVDSILIEWVFGDVHIKFGEAHVKFGEAHIT